MNAARRLPGRSAEPRRTSTVPLGSRHLLGWTFALAALLVLGAATAPHAQSLLDAGDAAFAGGDYSAAADFYEQALDRTDNPAEAAFRLATAKYRLAVETEDRGATLAQAQQLYRCCLEPDDPRQAEALLGLGNCLLLAGDGDGASLREALACYERCLRRTIDSSLAAAARYNREKARLLLLQLTPPSGQKPEQEPPNATNSEPKPPETQTPGRKAELGSEGTEEPNGTPGQVQQQPGQQARQTDAAPPPGKGNLSPIPDEADPAPLPPEKAAAHLVQAAKSIAAESEAHRRERRSKPAAGVRDW